MQKPQAIVFFDLDGTLLTSQVTVAPSTINAIVQLKQRNILPVIATGCTVCEVAHIMQLAGIDTIVSMNGQCVIHQQQKIYSNDIAPELIARFAGFAKQQQISVGFYNEQQIRVTEHSDAAITLYEYLREHLPPVDALAYQHMPVQMMLLLCQTGEDIFGAEFPELSVIRTTPYGVDVFNKNGSKAEGIKQLLNQLNWQDVPTYAFGDGLNDVEMFKLVDHPIAMQNAHPRLQALAEFVTDHHDHDGIVKGLQQAGLL